MFNELHIFFYNIYLAFNATFEVYLHMNYKYFINYLLMLHVKHFCISLMIFASIVTSV